MKHFGWLLFGLMVVYFIFLIRQDIIDNLELKKERAALVKKLENDKAATLALNDRLARLRGDELIEELARTRLGMIKRGETAYKVVQ
ncbi:MAG: septum formation initiator family protein [Candidatus Saganbacteria bacterium]|nr:septum formation initiator family protein [Candidatus Saganbacteria bacterium]